jgi:hypothetical protein
MDGGDYGYGKMVLFAVEFAFLTYGNNSRIILSL